VAIDFRRKSDIKLIIGATVAVLLVGFFVAGAMIVTTSGSGNAQCGQLTIGLASDIRNTLQNGPYFQSGGGNCGFWLALENGDITTYKVEQPSGCTLQWKSDHWDCGGETIPADRLDRYPLSIQTKNRLDVVIVNLGTPAPTS
jgi:hypothetical protein